MFDKKKNRLNNRSRRNYIHTLGALATSLSIGVGTVSAGDERSTATTIVADTDEYPELNEVKVEVTKQGTVRTIASGYGLGGDESSKVWDLKVTGLYNEDGNRTPKNAEAHIDSVSEGESVKGAGVRRHESINEVSKGASTDREFSIQNADSGDDYGVNAYEGEVRLLTVDPVGLSLCRTHNGAEWTEDSGSVDEMNRNYRGITFDYVESTWHIDEVGFLGSIDFYNDYAYTAVAGDYYNYNFGNNNERTDVSH